VNDPEVIGRRAEQSDWLSHAARGGLIAYGVVYLLLAWLAIQLALGDQSEDASPSGALQELAKQPFGKILVWGIALGMIMLVVWRLSEAAFGHREREGSTRTWYRLASAAKVVVYIALGVIAVQVALGSGSSSSSSKSSRGTTAKVMDLPAGQWIVVAVGLGVIVYGVGVIVRHAWKEGFAEELQTEGKLGWSGAGYLWLGKVGHFAKGVVLMGVGGLICYAGVTHEPQKSGGLDQALQKVLQQPFGPYLLFAVGIGIACYGLFSLAQARHLDR
jgi:uncharacterized membrane protein YhdT